MDLLKIFENRASIAEGLMNNVFKKDHVEAVYHQRMNICVCCEHYTEEKFGCEVPGTQPCCNIRTGGCGCSLAIKLRSLSASCPWDKWFAVMTKKEESELKSKIENDRAE
jgi:hypothetical protein